MDFIAFSNERIDNTVKTSTISSQCKDCLQVTELYSNTSHCTNCYEAELIKIKISNKKNILQLPDFSKITNNIYLGNSDTGNSYKLLCDLGVTHILICGSFLPEMFSDSDNFCYKVLPIEDTIDENISRFFVEAFEFIDSANVLLIYCFAGRSRSATILTAYFMYKYSCTLSQAFKMVKSKRKIISPNSGFIKTLKFFETYLIKNNYSLNRIEINKEELIKANEIS